MAILAHTPQYCQGRKIANPRAGTPETTADLPPITTPSALASMALTPRNELIDGRKIRVEGAVVGVGAQQLEGLVALEDVLEDGLEDVLEGVEGGVEAAVDSVQEVLPRVLAVWHGALGVPNNEDTSFPSGSTT